MKKPFRYLTTTLMILMLFYPFDASRVTAQEAVSDSAVQNRLNLIREMLVRGEPNADRWRTGWLAGYSAATLVQGIISLTVHDRNTREDMALGAATTFIGASGQIIFPFTASFAPDRLARFPENTPEERKAKLTEAERILEQCAREEREGKSLKMHALTGAVNLSSGLVTWLAFDRTAFDGFVNFLLNTLITEFQIWTQPHRAIEDYDRMIHNEGSRESSGGPKTGWTWSAAAVPGGIGIRISF